MRPRGPGPMGRDRAAAAATMAGAGGAPGRAPMPAAMPAQASSTWITPGAALIALRICGVTG